MMPLGMEVGPRDCVRWEPSPLPKMGRSPQFLAHVYCRQTAGWMKTPVGRKVDLIPDHIVLAGIPALCERGTAAPSFRPMSVVATVAHLSYLRALVCVYCVL